MAGNMWWVYQHGEALELDRDAAADETYSASAKWSDPDLAYIHRMLIEAMPSLGTEPESEPEPQWLKRDARVPGSTRPSRAWILCTTLRSIVQDRPSRAEQRLQLVLPAPRRAGGENANYLGWGPAGICPGRSPDDEGSTKCTS